MNWFDYFIGFSGGIIISLIIDQVADFIKMKCFAESITKKLEKLKELSEKNS